jgi:hypothetical protein
MIAVMPECGDEKCEGDVGRRGRPEKRERFDYRSLRDSLVGGSGGLMLEQTERSGQDVFCLAIWLEI